MLERDDLIVLRAVTIEAEALSCLLARSGEAAEGEPAFHPQTPQLGTK